METRFFTHRFSASRALDMGKLRSENQDRILYYPDLGFFAVSDGMGGLIHGGETANIIAEIIPLKVKEIADRLIDKGIDVQATAEELRKYICEVSDSIYNTSNTKRALFGATFSCVWLLNNQAVYINLGDSRGYFLPYRGRKLRQITADHNLAADLVQIGEIKAEEARNHSSASTLTQFIGMMAPSDPDVFIKPLATGDRILLCSDGLYGMVEDIELKKIMRSSRNPEIVTSRLAEAANKAGGKDNISAVYILIEK